MEELTKVAKKTWWDENDILKTFLEVTRTALTGCINTSDKDIPGEVLSFIHGAEVVVTVLLEATDADE